MKIPPCLNHSLSAERFNTFESRLIWGVNEKRKVFMRVDERLFYIF